MLFPVRMNGKYGYINNVGDVKIRPWFDLAFKFSDGLASVKVENLFGFIDTGGEVAIRPRFTSPSYFHEGLASVKDPETRKWGYIDKSGDMVIEPRDNNTDFSEGLGSVEIGGKWGCVNRSGKVVIEPMSDHSITFSEGLSPVLIDEEIGYIDKTGAFAIPLQFEYELALGFSEGLACVCTPKDEKPFFIDETGKIALIPEFSTGSSFFEGLAAVHNAGKSGFIDKTGRVVIDFAPFDVIRFSEGVCRVCNYSNKYGFINREGTIVVKPIFDWAEDFHEGLAYVEIYGKQGYVDRKGGYINMDGAFIWEPTA